MNRISVTLPLKQNKQEGRPRAAALRQELCPGRTHLNRSCWVPPLQRLMQQLWGGTQDVLLGRAPCAEGFAVLGTCFEKPRPGEVPFPTRVWAVCTVQGRTRGPALGVLSAGRRNAWALLPTMGQSEGQSNSAGPHWLVQPVPEPVLLLSLPTVLLPPTGADPEGIPESICCLLNSIAESASQENPTGSNAYRSSGDLVKMTILIKKKKIKGQI